MLRSQASSKATKSTEGQIISPSTLIQLSKPDKDTLCINLIKHTTFYPDIIQFHNGRLSFCYALENRSYAESKDNPMLQQPITENTPPAEAYHDKK